jgi:hypothetical protein
VARQIHRQIHRLTLGLWREFRGSEKKKSIKLSFLLHPVPLILTHHTATGLNKYPIHSYSLFLNTTKITFSSPPQGVSSHPSLCSPNSLSLSSSSPSPALVLHHLPQGRIRSSLPTPWFSTAVNLAPQAPAGATGTTARVRTSRGMAWVSARLRMPAARAGTCVMARSTHATPMDAGALRPIIGARRASTRVAGARCKGGQQLC